YTATGLPPGLSMRPESGVITGTPQQAGAWQATIQRSNGYQSKSDSLTFHIGTRDTAWELWKDTYWPAGSPDNSNDSDADPDGDGRTNLIEFAVGSHPLGRDGSDLLTATVNATGHLQLTLDIPVGRTGLVAWKTQFAGDPAVAPAVEVAPLTEPGPSEYVRLRFTDPVGSPARRRFGRLIATLE
ncbi:MAG TPA: putative Ig domain-containing protein, partial [Verrucomicrobiales bacterium]|nr:putative Ig domain-containing protein [Verrucomicrobiales bacterium]